MATTVYVISNPSLGVCLGENNRETTALNAVWYKEEYGARHHLENLQHEDWRKYSGFKVVEHAIKAQTIF